MNNDEAIQLTVSLIEVEKMASIYTLTQQKPFLH